LENLSGKSFLDIGSGSGLSSLAAHYLGATVHSFDFDEVSVNCTEELRRQYGHKSRDWVVGRGDVLDEGFMRSLGEFDIVYSWGVLHHTGNMSLALKQSRERVRPGGLLFVAIYNDQGSASRRWRWIKRTYNRLPVALRFLVALPSAVWLWGPTVIRDASQGNPFASWRQSERERGMSPWHDLKDWIGGYPFEVASPDAIIMPMQREGFVLRNLVCRTTGHGCNEYVFQRVS
jgi:SAM-dependent methyltransferase